MDDGAAQTTQALPAAPRRILIACSRCKACKIRCDGGRPNCGHCVARSAECTYPAARNYRGPAKSKSAIEGRKDSSREDPLGRDKNENRDVPRTPQTPVSASLSADHIDPHPQKRVRLEGSHVPRSPDTHTAVSSPRDRNPPGGRPSIFPTFLQPGAFEENLTRFKRSIDEARASGTFTALIPRHISHRLILNSFDDIMAGHRLLDVSSFLPLLHAQYADSPAAPAGQPARWGLVNAVLATALRSKIAPGAEAELSGVAGALYRNAVSVARELILQAPSLLSVQSLLAMAVFARGIPDDQAYYVLSANASRQVESLGRGGGSTIDPGSLQWFEQAHRVAHMFSADASQRLKDSYGSE